MDTRESYEAAAAAYAEHQSANLSVIERAHREMTEPSIPVAGVSLSRELYALGVRGHA